MDAEGILFRGMNMHEGEKYELMIEFQDPEGREEFWSIMGVGQDGDY